MNWSLKTMVAAAMLFASGFVIAQPPYELPKEATETELQEVVVPLSDAVKQKIADALARDAQRADTSRSTGDPILDDVLNVIRRQGSVLDGSSLDSQSSRENASAQMDSRATDNQLPAVPINPVPAFPLDGQQSFSGPEAQFLVAESLLRAARELASLPGRDPQRNRLIAAMREQATVLMIDEFSQLPSDSK